MMKNSIVKILVLVLIVTAFSCENGQETKLDPDYTVVEVNYAFHNYRQNLMEDTNFFIIKKRNLVVINVDKDEKIMINSIPVEDSLVVAELKKYIIPNPNDKEMPSTIKQEFEFSGRVVMNSNLCLLARFNKDLSYESYSTIRNKIFSAYNEVRDTFSLKKFNKTYRELVNSSDEIDDYKREEVAIIFPIRYSEDFL
jgi:hypothetical protein